MTAKLNVNIDHVATIREARKTIEPSIITAAVVCEQAGAHGITVHLRETAATFRTATSNFCAKSLRHI